MLKRRRVFESSCMRKICCECKDQNIYYENTASVFVLLCVYERWCWCPQIKPPTGYRGFLFRSSTCTFAPSSCCEFDDSDLCFYCSWKCQIE